MEEYVTVVKSNRLTILIDTCSQNNPGPKSTNATVVTQGQGQKYRLMYFGGGLTNRVPFKMTKWSEMWKHIAFFCKVSNVNKSFYDQLICTKKHKINCKQENKIIQLIQYMVCVCVRMCVYLYTCIHIEEHFLLIYCRGTHFPEKKTNKVFQTKSNLIFLQSMSSRTAARPSKQKIVFSGDLHLQNDLPETAWVVSTKPNALTVSRFK